MKLSKSRVTKVGALALVGAMTALTAAAAGGIGSDGVGDPYFPQYGNGGYDVANYDIDVEWLPETTELQGTTTVSATATEDLSQFNLDFLLDVTDVTVNGEKADFRTQDVHELVITPASELPAGEEFTVTVTYGGKPAEKRPQGWAAFAVLDDGGALALGQPESAMWWYPSNDHPTDKATFDVSITTPEDFTGVSIGRNFSTRTEGGKRTERWLHSEPTATYLAFLTVGQFDITKGHNFTTGTRWYNAITKTIPEGVDAEWVERSREDLDRTGEVVEWAEELYGPYLYSNYGAVVPAGRFGFALETASRPVYSPRFWRRGHNMSVVVHELAHQWYGNAVSVQTWRDIWLNEGFATWSSWKWAEDKESTPANASFKKYYQAYDADKDFWDVEIGNPGKDKVFNWAVYARGAMSVQALRNVIGDEAFFTLVKEWPASRNNGNATVEEFIAMAEETSGKDLTAFFDTWLFSTGKPAATVENGIPEADWANPPADEEARAAVADTRRDIEALKEIADAEHGGR